MLSYLDEPMEINLASAYKKIVLKETLFQIRDNGATVESV